MEIIVKFKKCADTPVRRGDTLLYIKKHAPSNGDCMLSLFYSGKKIGIKNIMTINITICNGIPTFTKSKN